MFLLLALIMFVILYKSSTDLFKHICNFLAMFTSYLLWSFCWLIMWLWYYIHACTNALFIVISMILTKKKLWKVDVLFCFFFFQSLTKRIWMSKSKFLVTLWHIYQIFYLNKNCLRNINAPWCKIQKGCIQWIIQQPLYQVW